MTCLARLYERDCILKFNLYKMETSKKKELLADLFEVEVSEIDENLSLIDFEPWDSMSKLSLIVLMDEECSKKLTGEQLREFKTIGDILAFMG